MQVTPQNIDQIIQSVLAQQRAIEERYHMLRDMDEALNKGDLLEAAKIWVKSQLPAAEDDVKIVQSNLDQLHEAKHRMSSGIVIPSGPMPPMGNSVSLK